jgi:Chromo (CHRromatin Organisation MOdifier) domain
MGSTEIRDAKRIDGNLHYLVKWAGWPSEYDSWEPAENLENAQRKVKEFEKTRAKKRTKTRRKRKVNEDSGDDSDSESSGTHGTPDLLMDEPALT